MKNVWRGDSEAPEPNDIIGSDANDARGYQSSFPRLSSPIPKNLEGHIKSEAVRG